ncbi:MAG: hydrogenase maturation protease [Pirellulales bacterium]
MSSKDEGFDPSLPYLAKVDVLIIGCGNILRGDDAAGPVFIRRLWEHGLPNHVRCADGGTGGMDVAFQMRGVKQVILIDACDSGSEPGTIFEVPGMEVEQLPPLEGINLHAFRWDHALAFARWLLKEDYPNDVLVYLIEGASYVIGDELSASVSHAVDRLVDRVYRRWCLANVETCQ